MRAPAGAIPDSEELAESLRNAFAEAPFPVVSAYLYGSHADGRAHRESDLDIAVLLPYGSLRTAKERFEVRVQLTSWLIGTLHNNNVDLVVLNDVPPTLGRHIVTTGRRVICIDEDSDHAFVRDVQIRAADLAPFLRRTRRVKLAAISQ